MGAKGCSLTYSTIVWAGVFHFYDGIGAVMVHLSVVTSVGPVLKSC